MLAPVIVVAALAIAGAWLAWRAGLRRGRAAERAALNRYLHDTVLQTLDALALAAPSDIARAPAHLAELRRVARAQAAELRQALGGQIRARRLDEELSRLVDELARDGLRTRLELADAGDGLPARRRAALRDATREALRNTVKHAGTDRAEVRVERRAGGIAVTARDHGVGFNPRDPHTGLGISESIVGRMAEVGGRAEVESRPGWGTRVYLWVPR